MSVIKVKESEFDQEVIQAGEPVLVDFYADWCGPCKMVAPLLEKIAEENPVKIVKVNVDENQQLAAKYQVMSIPTLIVFKDGEVINKIVGGASKETILQMITNV